MNSRHGEPEGIGIGDLDLAKIAEYLAPRLASFTASDNRYLHQGEWKEPTFTVVALLRDEVAIDAVLAVETACDPGLAFAGYEVVGTNMRFRHDLSEFVLYNGVASRLWGDQLAGDYPIGRVDFAHPEKITWPHLADEEVYLRTLDELFDYSQTRKASDDVWLNTRFLEKMKNRR